MVTVSIVALVISGFSLPFTIWAARAAARQAREAQEQTGVQQEQVSAAREQTELQRDLARESRQSYVWADIQPDMQQGSLLQVVVGNSGPTVAKNIRVEFSPALSTIEGADDIQDIESVLSNGISSLAPNRIVRWTLGVAHEVLSVDRSQLRVVRVTAMGPWGELPAYEMEIDINQWREARDAPDGSLHYVRGELKDITKVMKGIDSTLKQQTREIVAIEREKESSN